MTRKEMFEHIGEWSSFVRRHNANIFDVMFKDIDYSLTDKELNDIIIDVALFFDLEIPIINKHCDTLTEVHFGSNGKNSELYYNLQMMRNNGINNKDAFTLCIVHELAHLYLKKNNFMLCRNELWCHELAADYIVGIYSVLNNIATGKYKYVVSQMPMAITHPDGKHRAAVVEYARQSTSKYLWRNVHSSLVGLPAFIYERQRTLNDEFAQCIKNIQKK
mgnify:CR=1 FL=1